MLRYDELILWRMYAAASMSLLNGWNRFLFRKIKNPTVCVCMCVCVCVCVCVCSVSVCVCVCVISCSLFLFVSCLVFVAWARARCAVYHEPRDDLVLVAQTEELEVEGCEALNKASMLAVNPGSPKFFVIPGEIIIIMDPEILAKKPQKKKQRTT